MISPLCKNCPRFIPNVKFYDGVHDVCLHFKFKSEEDVRRQFIALPFNNTTQSKPEYIGFTNLKYCDFRLERELIDENEVL